MSERESNEQLVTLKSELTPCLRGPYPHVHEDLDHNHLCRNLLGIHPAAATLSSLRSHHSDCNCYKGFADNRFVMHSAGRTEVVHKNCSPEGGRQQVGLAGAAEVAVPAHSCSAAVAHSLAAEPGTHPGAESKQQPGNRQLGCRPAGHLHYSSEERRQQAAGCSQNRPAGWSIRAGTHRRPGRQGPQWSWCSCWPHNSAQADYKLLAVLYHMQLALLLQQLQLLLLVHMRIHTAAVHMLQQRALPDCRWTPVQRRQQVEHMSHNLAENKPVLSVHSPEKVGWCMSHTAAVHQPGCSCYNS